LILVTKWVKELIGVGYLAGKGVLDFAGGTAVHINAGAAGLALALVLGKRHGWRRDPDAGRTLCHLYHLALVYFGLVGSDLTQAVH
jgi:Amt family ammonium transporter